MCWTRWVGERRLCGIQFRSTIKTVATYFSILAHFTVMDR